MSSELILGIIIGILLFNFTLETILEWLNLRHMKTSIPKELEGLYEPEKYKQSLLYTREKTSFGMMISVGSTILMLVILGMGLFGEIENELAQHIDDPKWRALAFFGILFLANDIIGTPVSIYNTFNIEEKYGFNKTKPGTFIADKIKGWILTTILGGGILFLLMFLIEQLEENFWIWFWAASVTILILMNFLYPTLIVPIFNKLKPLEAGPLRDSIEEFAKKVNFPISKIQVIDGSKRSAKSNAYFAGIGKYKRVVLYDTLIENHSDEELLAILAHEVGHYKRKHIFQSFFFSSIQVGVMLFILSLMVFNEELTAAMGTNTGEPVVHLNLLAFGLLYSPISTAIGILMNMLSRKNEYEADDYAKQNYDGSELERALIKIHSDNLSNLRPHPAYVFFHYSHPTLLQRIQKLQL